MNWFKISIRRSSCYQIWITQIQNFPHFLHTYSKDQLFHHHFYDIFSSFSSEFLSDDNNQMNHSLPPDISNLSSSRFSFHSSDFSSPSNSSNILLSMDEIKPTLDEISFLSNRNHPFIDSKDKSNNNSPNSSPNNPRRRKSASVLHKSKISKNTDLSLVIDLSNQNINSPDDDFIENNQSFPFLSSVLLSSDLGPSKTEEDLYSTHPINQDDEIDEDEDNDDSIHNQVSYFPEVEEEEPLFLLEDPLLSTTNQNEEHIDTDYFYPPLYPYEDDNDSPIRSLHNDDDDDDCMITPSSLPASMHHRKSSKNVLFSSVDESSDSDFERNNLFFDHSQMMLPADDSPMIDNSLLNDIHSSLSVPISSSKIDPQNASHMTASFLLQGSPMNSLDSNEVSSILHNNTENNNDKIENNENENENSEMAQSIIQQLESNTTFQRSSSGLFTIRKTRSITAPTLRISNDNIIPNQFTNEGKKKNKKQNKFIN